VLYTFTPAASNTKKLPSPNATDATKLRQRRVGSRSQSFSSSWSRGSGSRHSRNRNRAPAISPTVENVAASEECNVGSTGGRNATCLPPFSLFGGTGPATAGRTVRVSRLSSSTWFCVSAHPAAACMPLRPAAQTLGDRATLAHSTTWLSLAPPSKRVRRNPQQCISAPTGRAALSTSRRYSKGLAGRARSGYQATRAAIFIFGSVDWLRSLDWFALRSPSRTQQLASMRWQSS
jgi:hypothetical protein